ncbi:CapA family protein [Peptococcus simiae]|uniref:CapA family protein n=2 Tax=Peptococcus simiae TaxID=1643805 RepID=A0ABW9GZR4_9FIRM
MVNPFHLQAGQPLQETLKYDKAETVGPQRAELLCGGDIVFHPITYSSQYEQVVPPYDFSHMFVRMGPHLARADFATITFETVCDPDMPYAGYPVFNSPTEAIPAMKKVGFGALATATNHALDGAGLSSHDKTLRAMDQAGVDHFGSYLPDKDRTPYIKDIQGIKVAFLNYAEMYNGNEVALADQDLARLSPLKIDLIRQDITAARQAGADLVAVFPHWGIEYQTLPSPEQRELAREMVAAGADLVIGSHPHVIAPAEWIDQDGRRAYVAYSLGNAMSNQRAAFLGTIDTEIGCFLRLQLEKDKEGSRVKEASLLPSTVYINTKTGGKKYEAGLIQDFLVAEDLTDQDKAHMTNLKNRAEEILGQALPA